jgi:hypothetical protein
MAALSALRLSAGLSLLSMPLTSNFTPAGIARAAELLGDELVAFELVDADRPEQAAEGIDAHHLHRLALLAAKAAPEGRPAPLTAMMAANGDVLMANSWLSPARMLNARRVQALVHCTAQGMPVSSAAAISHATEWASHRFGARRCHAAPLRYSAACSP